MAKIPRNQSRIVFYNNEPEFDDFRRARGLSTIKQYATSELKYPTKEEILSLNTVNYIWTVTDRYEKLAAKFYGNPEMWWVIAYFNKKPAEFLIRPGTSIKISLPLEYILDYYGI